MSKEFILEASNLAQWHALVKEAETQYGCQLDEVLESYLVFTLMRFMKDQAFGTQAIATNYLNAQHLSSALRADKLRDIGDECLLLSGLFPKRADKKLVRVSYYIDIGRSAYHRLSLNAQNATADLYGCLADTFVLLMDLLQTIRRFSAPALLPLQAYDLWNDTGSIAALSNFNEQSLPVHESVIDMSNIQ